METELKELAVSLYDINAIKFGEFITKVGLKTPVYFDLRIIIAYPKVMLRLAKVLWKFSDNLTDIHHICGVPYTALPLATLISAEANIPMLIKRKETKDYGTKKLIEGKFQAGDHCIIIEDVVTSGSSVIETTQALKKEDLKVTETFVVIDREQGGRKNLENHGIHMRSLYTVTQLMEYLVQAGKVTKKIVQEVSDYLKSCQAPVIPIQNISENRVKLSFHKRADLASNAMAAKLLQLMETKQSTVCLAADLTKTDAILELANLAGPHIVVLKIHVDIIEDFNENFIKRLKELAKKYQFLLMEDRKFGDIGNTVSLQYRKGIYKIAEWADLVTVHAVPGSSVIDGLKNGLNDITESRGFFLVTEMSSKDALTTGDYVKNAVSIAQQSDTVIGLVCQSNIFSDPGLIQLTPGVKLSKSFDNLGQQYNTPESVVNAGADLAVIGRGVTEAQNKLDVLLEYKIKLWEAYEKRIDS